MSNPNKDIDWMTELRSLLPDWDGEGAPIPSEESILKTKDIVGWAILNNLNIDSIDADVLGGVAIYLTGIRERMVWVSILNNGKPCVVFRCCPRSKVIGHIFNNSSFEELKSFLTNDDCNLCNKLE